MKKKKRGFTLIEMMAVIAITGIFLTLIFSLFTSSSSMLYMAEKDNVLQNEARAIIDVLEEEIKYSPHVGEGSGWVQVDKIIGGAQETMYFRIQDREFQRYDKANDKVVGVLSHDAEEFTVKKAKDENGNEIKNLHEVYIRLKSKDGKSDYDYTTRIQALNNTP